jgi:uncharacterized protein
MAGERLTRADLTANGIAGDRVVQVYDKADRIVTARAYPGLLALHATTYADGEPLVDGSPWQSNSVARLVEAAVAPGAHLARYEGTARFDVLPLLVCTDGELARFGRDVRRLRPNLVIEGVAPTTERGWPGALLRLPHARIRLDDLRARCVMTTYDPDDGRQDPRVHRDIVQRFEGRLCLNAAVVHGGIVETEHSVELVQFED